MKTRKLGSLDVTIVGVGCNNFGRELDFPQTQEVVSVALDEGIRFFDTADTYGTPKTMSEQYLGRALSTHRDEVVIATKVGSWIDERRGGGKADYIRSAVDASLTRLRTDRIDLLQLHWPDPGTPIAETLGAMGEVALQGKVREIGCSNFTGAMLHEARDAVRPGHPAFASVQNEYSLLSRHDGGDALPACRDLGMAYLPYFPLAHGLLTGKYRRDQPPPDNFRLANRGPEVVDRVLTERNYAIVDKLATFVEARGRTLIELAFSWLLSEPLIPSVIAGVRTPIQVRSNAAAACWQLDAAELAELDQITMQQEDK